VSEAADKAPEAVARLAAKAKIAPAPVQDVSFADFRRQGIEPKGVRTAAPPGLPRSRAQGLALQRTLGNRAVSRLLQPRTAAKAVRRVAQKPGVPVAEEEGLEGREAVAASMSTLQLAPAGGDVPPGGALPADSSAAAKASGKTNFTDERTSYTVTATTLKAAADQISKREEAGKTNWLPKFSVETDDGGQVTKVTVDVKITVLMPEWAGAGKLGAADKAKWDSFITALEAHEQGHVKQAREKLADVGQSMIGQTKKAAGDTFKAALKDLQDTSDAYDTETDHGRNKGCEIVIEE
jgi:predicted secreted Zn-dependent protease